VVFYHHQATQGGYSVTNIELRLEARRNDIPLWKVAKFLNIGENTLYRWLRSELNDETRGNILRAISKIKEGQADVADGDSGSE
jgi:hypothetical protein